MGVQRGDRCVGPLSALQLCGASDAHCSRMATSMWVLNLKRDWRQLKNESMRSSAELLLVRRGKGRCPPLPWGTAALPQELARGRSDPACWTRKAEESCPVPTLAWGCPQLCSGLEDPIHGHGAMSVFHGRIRPRAIQGYRESPSLTLPCRQCLEARGVVMSRMLSTKLGKSEVKT